MKRKCFLLSDHLWNQVSDDCSDEKQKIKIVTQNKTKTNNLAKQIKIRRSQNLIKSWLNRNLMILKTERELKRKKSLLSLSLSLSKNSLSLSLYIISICEFLCISKTHTYQTESLVLKLNSESERGTQSLELTNHG